MVLVAVSIPGPSPFLLEVLESVSALDYPPEKMGIFVHNEVRSVRGGGGGGGGDQCLMPSEPPPPPQAQYHEVLVSAWFEMVASSYAHSMYISSTVGVSLPEGKRKAM